MNITFEPLKKSHFPIMLQWLEAPHVKKWWDQEVVYNLDLVKEKYGDYIRGFKRLGSARKSIKAYIIGIDNQSIGYIQLYNAMDFPRSKPLARLPERLGAFDIFIGDKKYLGRNIGSRAIIRFLELYGDAYSHIFTDPETDNIPAIKAYEKAGFKKVSEQKDTEEVWMIWKKEANWELYYIFEEVVHWGTDAEVKKILDQFDLYDFLSIPIVFDLVNYKKIRLLKILYKQETPLTYEESDGDGNALHVACGAGGNIESVKFLVENNIFQDINKKSLKFGDTPLTLAISYGHRDIVGYFKGKLGANGVSLDDLDVILDRIKSNYRRLAMRKAFLKYEKKDKTSS